MNGHSPYLVVLLAVLIGFVALSINRLLAEQRAKRERAGIVKPKRKWRQ